MANYLTVALFSIMVFYSFGIAINVHRTLDKENAGKLLRKLFPIYFFMGNFYFYTSRSYLFTERPARASIYNGNYCYRISLL